MIFKKIKKMVNNLGKDLDEWFNDNPHPHDSMPVATNKYHPDKDVADWYDNAPSEYEPPMEDSDWFIEKPKAEEKKEEKTIHQKMYEIATAKYNPFAVGGSESISNK
jgi:hypothetical protein|tara:strand:- start:441 stop:761 length:321 start_codon:yes stop_codon:yes gene_type:complete